MDRDVMRMVAAGMLLGLATLLVFPLLALGQAQQGGQPQQHPCGHHAHHIPVNGPSSHVSLPLVSS